MAKGRKTGGKPKGYRHQGTIDKVLKREELRRLICAELVPMTMAQIEQAKGLKYLVTRDKKTGKFIRVTEAMARAKVGDAEEIIEVWEKDPSTHAYADLLNRALDKPVEPIEERVTHDGVLTIEVKVPW